MEEIEVGGEGAAGRASERMAQSVQLKQGRKSALRAEERQSSQSPKECPHRVELLEPRKEEGRIGNPVKKNVGKKNVGANPEDSSI